MRDIIDELSREHAREAALLWELQRGDGDAGDLRMRLDLHLAGMLAGARLGADPLADLERPLRGADLFPAAWLARALAQAIPVADGDDDDGAAAIADAQAWP